MLGMSTLRTFPGLKWDIKNIECNYYNLIALVNMCITFTLQISDAPKGWLLSVAKYVKIINVYMLTSAIAW